MCRQIKVGVLVTFFGLLLSENPDVHPKKNEPLSQEMHLKILHFSSGLKMSEAVEKLLFTDL
jgi:hypothetical protein